MTDKPQVKKSAPYGALYGCLAFAVFFFMYTPAEGLRLPIYKVLICVAVVLLALATFMGAIEMIGRAFPKGEIVSRIVRAGFSAYFFTLFFWVQIDLFLNSIFGFNSIKRIEKDSHKIAFAAFILCIAALAFKKLLTFDWKISWRRSVTPMILSLGVVGAMYIMREDSFPKVAGSDRRDNIIVMSFDSLGAKYLDMDSPDLKKYFPFIASIKGEVYYARNAYSNSCCTHGAVASLYTGVTPLETKVPYPPGRLDLLYSRKNLPTILKALGYETHSYTTGYYANARQLNIVGGFDNIEGEAVEFYESYPVLKNLYKTYGLLSILSNVKNQYSSRVHKYFFNQKIFSPFYEVSNQAAKLEGDAAKIKYLLSVINQRRDRPQFLHAHFMALHQTSYSVDSAATQFRVFDEYAARVYSELKVTGQLERTILVITSDHGPLWSVSTVPLIFRFPEGKHHGHIDINTQFADIAPTVTDFMGVRHDVEFKGSSLLRPENIDPAREIVNIAGILSDKLWEPPHFKMSGLKIIKGDQSFSVSHDQFKIDSRGNIAF